MHWQVPARGELPPVRFTWHHGGGLSPGSKDRLLKMMTDRGASAEQAVKLLGYAGAMLVGPKGVLVTDDHNVKFTLLPGLDFRDVQQDVPHTLPQSRGHYNDWLIACRGGAPAMANFACANPLSEFLMLVNVATQFDAELEYDPAAMKVVNHADANAALGYKYREGCSL